MEIRNLLAIVLENFRYNIRIFFFSGIHVFPVYKRTNRLTQCTLDGFVFDCCFALCGSHATLQAFDWFGGSLSMCVDWQRRRCRCQVCCFLSLTLLLICFTVIWEQKKRVIVNRNNGQFMSIKWHHDPSIDFCFPAGAPRLSSLQSTESEEISACFPEAS